MSRLAGRRGHTLVELVVALPILAIGGAAAAGLVLMGSGILLQAEQRAHAALLGSSLADSLRLVGEGEGVDGWTALPGGEMEWSWDGAGALVLTLPGRREDGALVRWRLEALPPDAEPDEP
jgi:type II secretory pathway pseudopilin PulG